MRPPATRTLARRSAAPVPVHLAHAYLRVRDVMRTSFPVAKRGDPVRSVGLLMASEGMDLVPIVDLMHDLRAAEARRHTREELPFLTGRRRPLADAVADLP